jgi:8-oxo-dGTP diphosphatase
MTIVVAAAVVERDGRILVTKRPAGVHLEGHWEFPGGKCAAGEAPEQCLMRELREELDADISVGTELLATSHDYGDRRIELHFFSCQLRGERGPSWSGKCGGSNGAAWRRCSSRRPMPS